MYKRNRRCQHMILCSMNNLILCDWHKNLLHTTVNLHASYQGDKLETKSLLLLFFNHGQQRDQTDQASIVT